MAGWVKGQSGNPKGRPPKDKSFKRMLSQKVHLEKQVKRLLELAESADESIALKAILAISDRLDGTPIQSLRAHVTELPQIVVAGKGEALPDGMEEGEDPNKDFMPTLPDVDVNLMRKGHSAEKTV